MQTFLPYPDFDQSARCLDRQRLGKQRIECVQLLRALREGGGWANHPAARMWRGHEYWLVRYTRAVISEWTRRGYKNNLILPLVKKGPPPSWLGDEKFHASHRSNLLRKFPEHYGRFGWTEPSDLPYVWPVQPPEGASQEKTMTKKTLKGLPAREELEKMPIGELENLHSEMLATCTDIGYEPGEDYARELHPQNGDSANNVANANILTGLHDGISEFLERHPEGKKPLAEDGKKTDNESAGKKSRSTKKAAEATDSNQKENTVATTAKKKAPAKKAAAKTSAKKAAKKVGGNGKYKDDQKITWILADDKGLGVREGSSREERRKLLKRHNGKTVGAFLKAGGKASSLSSAVAEKVVRVA